MKTPGIQDEIEYHIILFLKQDCNNKIIREICKSKAFKGSSNGVLIDNFKEHVLDLYSQSGTSSAGQMQSCLVQTAGSSRLLTFAGACPLKLRPGFSIDSVACVCLM